MAREIRRVKFFILEGSLREQKRQEWTSPQKDKKKEDARVALVNRRKMFARANDILNKQAVGGKVLGPEEQLRILQVELKKDVLSQMYPFLFLLLLLSFSFSCNSFFALLRC